MPIAAGLRREIQFLVRARQVGTLDDKPPIGFREAAQRPSQRHCDQRGRSRIGQPGLQGEPAVHAAELGSHGTTVHPVAGRADRFVGYIPAQWHNDFEQGRAHGFTALWHFGAKNPFERAARVKARIRLF